MVVLATNLGLQANTMQGQGRKVKMRAVRIGKGIGCHD